ncbi:hypothetical protein [Streptomyces sp. WM4235]|uniref:hypothetical protein n=1 Tax=Streptomyces sp. WM4235 TaxID=1415551 RepID=UPI00131A8A75|nr:hypothetical protein [Streptomyces sp. WM4235]
MGEARAHDVVEVACAALVAGLDSPTLRILAGYTRAEAENEVPHLLPAVLDGGPVALHDPAARGRRSARAAPPDSRGSVPPSTTRCPTCAALAALAQVGGVRAAALDVLGRRSAR